jgi:hypothetical protein
VLGSGWLEWAAEGRRQTYGLSLHFGYQYHEEILIALRGLTLGENREVVKFMLRQSLLLL